MALLEKILVGVPNALFGRDSMRFSIVMGNWMQHLVSLTYALNLAVFKYIYFWYKQWGNIKNLHTINLKKILLLYRIIQTCTWDLFNMLKGMFIICYTIRYTNLGDYKYIQDILYHM